jgi:divalent metal cation (Fe/Co/Zn/Cd) transporter
LQIMERLIRHFDTYEQLQRIRTRRSGPVLFIEVFLEFDPAMTHGEALARAEQIRLDLESAIAGSEVAVVAV